MEKFGENDDHKGTRGFRKGAGQKYSGKTKRSRQTEKVIEAEIQKQKKEAAKKQTDSWSLRERSKKWKKRTNWIKKVKKIRF